jgi:predicted DNA repair protein MutK
VAFAEKQDFSADCQRVCNVVRGHHGLNVVFGLPLLQAQEESIASDAVERGKGLVEQQQARARSQSAGKSDALRLAAGKILRAEICEVGCADKLEHFFDAIPAAGAIEMVQTIGDIGGGVEVREERGLL